MVADDATWLPMVAKTIGKHRHRRLLPCPGAAEKKAVAEEGKTAAKRKSKN